MLVISLSPCRAACRIRVSAPGLFPLGTLFFCLFDSPYSSDYFRSSFLSTRMRFLFALLSFLCLLALSLAAPHQREDVKRDEMFDYDYKELFADADDLLDKEGVAVDRMVGKKAERHPSPVPVAGQKHHHHHHHHHHHKEHLKTNRVRNFFDDFRL